MRDLVDTGIVWLDSPLAVVRHLRAKRYAHVYAIYEDGPQWAVVFLVCRNGGSYWSGM